MPPVRIVRADAEGAVAAAEVLRSGGVAVVPTDTVYGLAARPGDADAVQAVFRAKGRPEGMHLPVLAASVAQVRALGVAFNAAAEVLAESVVAGTADPGLRLRPRAGAARLAGRTRGGGGPHPGPRLPARAAARADRCARRDQRQPARRADAAHGPRRGGQPRPRRRPGRRRRPAQGRALDAGQRARTRGGGRARGSDRASRDRARAGGTP